MSRSKLVPIFASLFLVAASRALGYGECNQITGGIDLLLHESENKATASANATCIAVNGQENFEGSFSGNIKISQVNPAIDYVSPYTATGQWIGSLGYCSPAPIPQWT